LIEFSKTHEILCTDGSSIFIKTVGELLVGDLIIL